MSFIRLAFRGVVTRNLASPSLSRLHQSRLPQRAAFSAASALDKPQIETRVLDVLKSFEKVHPEKVCIERDELLWIIHDMLSAQALRHLRGRSRSGQFRCSRSCYGRRGGLF